jgi:hypothetical protein
MTTLAAIALLFLQIIPAPRQEQASFCPSYSSIVWIATSNLEGYVHVFETLGFRPVWRDRWQSPLDQRPSKPLYDGAEFCPYARSDPMVRILAVGDRQRLDARVFGLTRTFHSPNVWLTLALVQGNFPESPKVEETPEMISFVFADGEGNVLTFEGTP